MYNLVGRLRIELEREDKKLVDFHIHTTFSDGTFTPEEVVKMAAESGMKAIAVTDHDSVEGTARARSACEQAGIEFVSGIEISTDYMGKEVHILGYFINEKDEEFLGILKELQEERGRRTEKIIKRLNELNIRITMSDVLNESTSGLISRNHIASAMLKRGYVYSRGAAFHEYLGSSGAAYIPKTAVTPEKAVEMITKNGGVAVMAHPHLLPLGAEKFDQFLKYLKSYGLKGIEGYYNGFEQKEINIYRRIADENGLIVTGGSDFHGLTRDGVKIGAANVPDTVYFEMKSAAGKKEE